MLYTTDARGVRQPIALRCDCCQREYRDLFELQESLHIHLRAGYGSRWGDGNHVDVALCDACAVQILSPYATVTAMDDLPGHHAGGFVLPPELMMVVEAFDAEEARDSQSTMSRTLHGVAFQLHRYLVPAIVLLRPLWQAARRLHLAFVAENRRIARKYRRPSG
jgi:hypothetical protein